MQIGSRIQFHRTRHGLSQEGLAGAVGVTRQSVSKWELGQALPDLDKVVQLCQLFNLTTDELILDAPQTPEGRILRWGLYLLVKDFAASVKFYEKLLGKRATLLGCNRFAEFRFDGVHWLFIMNESHLPHRDYNAPANHNFALNLWVKDLAQEHRRVMGLNIGPVTEIMHPHSNYYFFNVIDPDKNVVEITGEIIEEETP
ncbi:MAG: helix-turn-helix domain-containing protein [Defluviitaleaceae bacterium]|nr:helix-turn-helix domain-containing protein [Defluviitaleaceae bacterium]MCL2274234.1 helix-turn-helix domain-containing protein [Defluviitaleaceae bacterium]